MDRRVFQPRTDSRAERRRNALMMAAIVLLAGWLWLLSARNHHPAAVSPVRAVRPLSKNQ